MNKYLRLHILGLCMLLMLASYGSIAQCVTYPANATSSTPVSCRGGSDGTITVNVIKGASGSQAFLLERFDFTTNSFRTVQGPIVSTTETYTFLGLTASQRYRVVTFDGDDVNCDEPIITTFITVSQPATSLNVVLASKTNIENCFGEATGAIDITVSGAIAPYTYQWSNGATTEDVSSLTAGDYTVVVTDSKGCTKDLAVKLTQPAPLSAAILTQTNASCNASNNGSATVEVTGGTAPYSYRWNTTPEQTGATATGLTAGNYTVTVTDAKGCKATTNVAITEPAPFTASFIAVPACLGGATGSVDVAVVGGTAPYSYQWTGGLPDQEDHMTIPAGNYSVIITDSKGCKVNLNTILIAPQPIAVISGNSSICNGETVTLTFTLTGKAPWNLTYLENGSNPVTIANITNPTHTITVSPTVDAVYTIESVQDANCDSDGSTSGEAKVTVKEMPNAPIASNDGPVCAGGNLNLSATSVGGATYSWTGPNGFTSTSQNPVLNNATIAMAGVYTVTATINGCTSMGSTTNVSINNVPAAPVVTSPVTYCQDTQAIALTAAGNNLLWYTSATGGTGSATAPVPQTTTAGTTTYYVSQRTGSCESPRAAIEVVIKSLPQVPVISGDLTFCSGSNTVLSSSATTGNQWYKDGNPIAGAMQPTLNVSVAGSYRVEVTANGCLASSAIVVVSEKAMPAVPVASSNGPLCEGETINLFATAITGATYAWTGPNGFSSASQNPVLSNATPAMAGAYKVRVTVDGCTSNEASTNVVINAKPVTPIISGNLSFCSGNSTTLTSSSATGNQWFLNNSPISGQTARTLVVTSAGNYTVAVTTNGCSTTSAVATVEEKATPSTPVISTNSPVCAGEVLNLSTSAVAGATYSWTGPNGFTSNQQNLVINNASVSNAGSYSLRITVDGCTSSEAIINVVINTKPVSPVISGTLSFCSGSSTTLTSSIATGNQWYLNDNPISGQTTNTLTVNTPGNYKVEVTNGSNCIATSNAVTVTEKVMPATPIASNNGPVCAGSAATLSATTIAGASYLWTGPNGYTSNEQNPVIANAAAGIYRLTATINGCTSGEATTTVIVNALPAIPVISGNLTFCSGSNTTLTSSAATGNHWYLNNNPISEQTGNSITVSIAGNYTVRITENGCSTTSAIVVVNQVATPATPVISGDLTFCSGSNTVLNSSATTGNQWYKDGNPIAGATQPTLSVSVAGSYRVEVTANGCLASSAIVAVSEKAMPAAPVASSNGALCEGETINLFATAITGANYAWTGPNGFSSASQNPVLSNASIAMTGAYRVRVTVDGCTSSEATTNVTINVKPDASIQAVSSLCADAGAITLQSATIGGQWSGKGITDAAIGTFDPQTAGMGTHTITYTVTVNGCTSVATKEITINSAVSMPVVTSPLTYCEGTQAIALTANGNSLLWYTSPTGGTGSATAPVPQTTNAGTTTYYVSQTTGSCESPRTAIEVQVTSVPTIAIESFNNPSTCNASDGNITVSVVSGAKYSLDGRVYQDSNIFPDLPANSYTVYIQDANKCISTITRELVGPVGIIASANASNETACEAKNGTITVNASGVAGTYSYYILEAGAYKPNPDGINNKVFSGLAPTSYTIRIVASNNCEYILNNIPVGTECTSTCTLAATTESTDNVCAGGESGSVTVKATGGKGSYFYSIDGGKTFLSTSTFGGLKAGEYTILVKDDACEVTVTATVDEPKAISATVDKVIPTSCSASDGSLTINIQSGGTAPFTYRLGNSGLFSTENTFNNLQAGNHVIYIADDAGCQFIIEETLNSPGGMTAIVMPIAESVCGANNGMLLVSVSGGSTPYNYLIDLNNNGVYIPNPSGTGSNLFTGLEANKSYRVKVESADGCSYITAPQMVPTLCVPVCSLTASIQTQKDVSCNGGSDGSLVLQVTGGSGSYEYSINEIDYAPLTTLVDLQAKTYTISIRDVADKSCTTSLTATIGQPEVLTIQWESQTEVTGCHGDATGSVTVSAKGGKGGYTYSVDGSTFSASNTFNKLQAKIYNKITVKDENGCTAILPAVTITGPDAIMADLQRSNPTACGASDGTITVINPRGGSGSFEYSKDGATFQDAATFPDLVEGSYTITVRDKTNKDCFITINQVLNSTNGFTADATATAESTCGANDGKILVSVPGNIPTYQFYINKGSGFVVNPSGNEFNGLNPGDYAVKVISSNGCEFIINDIKINAAICSPICTIAAEVRNPKQVSCFGNNDGEATVTVNGGTAPYTYSWNTNPVQTSATATELAAGAYTVTVRDANGCIATTSVNITQPAQINAPTVSNSGPVCTGETISLLASDILNASYSWTGPNGYTSNMQNPLITNATAVNSGTYSLMVTVGNCTSTVVSTTVIVNNRPDASITAVASLCSTADAITLQAATAGGIWSGNGITGANAGIFDPKVAGVGTHTITYSVTVNGCSSTATRDVVVTATSPAPVVTSPVTYCVGNQATALTANGTNLLWYTTATSGTGSSTAPVPSTQTAGSTTYYVSQNTNGCGESTRSAITVVVKPATDPTCICSFTAEASSRPVSCAGGSDGAALAVVTQGGSGQFLYRLLNSNQAPQTLNTFIATFNQQPKGPFEIEITDQVTACKAIVSNIIGTDVTLIVPFERINPTCAGNDGKLDFAPIAGGKGPYRISIDGGKTFFTTQTGDTTFASLPTGAYDVIVSDAKPCRVAVQVTLEGTAPLAASFVSEQPQTCNTKGKVIITPTGGEAPYTYSIDYKDFVKGNGEFDLDAGNYNITVKDNKDCQVSFTTTIAPLNVVTAGEPTLVMPTCKGNQDGQITWNSTNTETAAYQYSINNGTTWQGSPTFKGLGAGIHTIMVQNGPDCRYSFSYTLTDPEGMDFKVVELAGSACGENTGRVEVTDVKGGSGSYFYSLNNSTYQSSPVFEKLTAGPYTMYVRDNTSGQCSLVQKSFTVSGVAAITYKVDSVSIGCEGGNKGSIVVHQIKGGNKPYQISIDNGNTWQFVLSDSIAYNDLAPNTYQLVIKYGTNCQTAVRNVNIYSGGLPIDVSTTAATCGSSNGSATAIMPDASKKYFYSIDNNRFQESPVFLDLKAGRYTMYVRETASDLCPKQTSFAVAGPDSLKYDLKKTDCFDVRVLNISGGTSPYRVSLDGGKTFVSGYIFPQSPNYLATNLPSGEYSIVVADNAGCATIPVRVRIDNKITAKVTATLSMPDEPTGEIRITDIRGGNAPYEVSIDGLNWAVVKDKTLPVDTVITAQHMGRYVVYIRDANGCVKEYETEIQESKFTIPNIFTPNGDGVNDTFFIRNLPAGTFVTISNRWGKIIYKSSNYQNDWTGEGYSEGIYYFTVNIAGQGQHNGWVEIKR